ncbi:MAG: hypothetical protein OES25_16855 [Acidobacteriota bacterium]|nr:hypothetical protein [Acidobacteriota bacterium]
MGDRRKEQEQAIADYQQALRGHLLWPFGPPRRNAWGQPILEDSEMGQGIRRIVREEINRAVGQLVTAMEEQRDPTQTAQDRPQREGSTGNSSSNS